MGEDIKNDLAGIAFSHPFFNEIVRNTLNYIEELEKNSIPKSTIKENMKKYEYALNGYDSSTADSKQSQDVGSWIALQKLLEE